MNTESDTPRTQKAWDSFASSHVQRAHNVKEASEQLERELNETKETIEMLETRHGATMLCHQAQIEEITKQRDALAEVIQWALGMGEDGFRERCINEGQYWWRKELRERAALASTKGGSNE